MRKTIALIVLVSTLIMTGQQIPKQPTPFNVDDHVFIDYGSAEVSYGFGTATAMYFTCDTVEKEFGTEAELNSDERIELFHLRARLAEAERDQLFEQLACQGSKEGGCEGSGIVAYVAGARKAREEVLAKIAKAHFLGPRSEVDEDIKVMWPEAKYDHCEF